MKKYRLTIIYFIILMLTTSLFIFVLSGFSASALLKFLTAPFSSPYYFGRLLNTAGLYLVAAIGATLALQTGNINLGGEGQVYAGGFVTAVLLSAIPANVNIIAKIPFFFSAAIISAIIPSLMCYIPALLYQKKKLLPLLSTFLLSGAVIPVIDAAIAGPFRGASNNLLATAFLPITLRLKAICPPSPLNASFFLALVLYVVFAFIVYKTKTGRVFRICGKAPDFALYTGYNLNGCVQAGLTLSGAMHGLCGFFAVTGTYYTCHSEFYSGYGWNALTIALIAFTSPKLLVPATFFMAYLFTASDKAALTNNINSDFLYIIQAIIILCITARPLKRGAVKSK